MMHLQQSVNSLPECVNCDQPIADPKFPFLFCCELCKQEASYVRRSRRVLADGRWERPDIKQGLAIELAMILGGGYPEQERRLSVAQRRQILERDGHACRDCGQAANEIDHIRGAGVRGEVNDPANLQTLCAACHRTKTLQSIRRVTQASDPELWERLETKRGALDLRIFSGEPQRPCDDEAAWDGQLRHELTRHRRQQLVEHPVVLPSMLPYGVQLQPSGGTWRVVELEPHSAGGVSRHTTPVSRYVGVGPVDAPPFRSFPDACACAEEWSASWGSDPLEEALLSYGVLPGENPDLERLLLLEMDQPDL